MVLGRAIMILGPGLERTYGTSKASCFTYEHVDFLLWYTAKEIANVKSASAN